MPIELWRNKNQPGNILDKRDEMCAAQKRLRGMPAFLGLDDYPSTGYQLHYPFCGFKKKSFES